MPEGELHPFVRELVESAPLDARGKLAIGDSERAKIEERVKALGRSDELIGLALDLVSLSDWLRRLHGAADSAETVLIAAATAVDALATMGVDPARVAEERKARGDALSRFAGGARDNQPAPTTAGGRSAWLAMQVEKKKK